MSQNPTAPSQATAILIVGELLAPNEWRGIPDLPQLIPSGGRPGVEYCLIPASQLGVWQRDGWWMVPRVDPMTVHGPKGSVDGVLLLGYGEPIPGASPSNGRRRYCAHQQLLEDLGYMEPAVDPATVARLRAETDAHKARAVGAARRVVDQQTAVAASAAPEAPTGPPVGVR